MKSFKFFLPIIFCLVTSSCWFSDAIERLQNKTKQLEEITTSACNCDKVMLTGYSEDAFRSYASLEIIGADFSKHTPKEIASQINDSLKSKMKDFCDIDRVQLIFTNKNKQKSFIIRYCKIDD
ncbi:MAG: hypothetical protein J7604_21220 [Sporocytophaga sp.]|uniref:hypothetical protein n=1 Tax=Sporocytophaga sp. TaxID=2231183 RepID=UPI001B192012|nr:hypothetical protein [Sporocytophaga sp.]MBO9702747.1 hypothetical protein [Sporocytophaga sp.]